MHRLVGTVAFVVGIGVMLGLAGCDGDQLAAKASTPGEERKVSDGDSPETQYRKLLEWSGEAMKMPVEMARKDIEGEMTRFRALSSEKQGEAIHALKDKYKIVEEMSAGGKK